MTTYSRLCLLVAAGVAVATTSAAAQAGNNTEVLNPNLAGAEELAAVPQLNDALVKAIMDGRPFLSMQAFHDAVGSKLGADDAAALYVGVFVPINLNTASEAEILMVPGVGNRMAHEFDEYRPYRALAQFRREIGKYVDDDEVARMEQYVFVPIDLNTASEEDILSLPGVGDRMAHEFDEYRPWKSFEQFRREIGKYVDDDEVARLERFVVINP